jgi:hypothetical protein
MAALAELIRRVERALGDVTNLRFDEVDLEEALRTALDVYGCSLPLAKIDTITLTADGREVSLAELSDLLGVERVWYAYDASDPAYPPGWVAYQVWQSGTSKTLFVDSDTEPQTNDVLRIYYAARPQVENLDDASETTVPAEDEYMLVRGAAGYAAISRAALLVESIGVDRDTATRLRAWGEERVRRFLAVLEIEQARRVLSVDARVGGWGAV